MSCRKPVSNPNRPLRQELLALIAALEITPPPASEPAATDPPAASSQPVHPHTEPNNDPTNTNQGESLMTPAPSMFTRTRQRLLIGLLALLACVAAPAFAQETCGTDPATSPNHSDNYILGEIEGEAAGTTVLAAMHWPTGLVWKRCAQGHSGADCSGGNDETRRWNEWMDEFMPGSFTGQDAWWGPVGTYTPDPATGPVGVDRLQDGTWRMPYRLELAGLLAGCEGGPKINRNVFPNTPLSYFWSGSPIAGLSNYAWGAHFGHDGVYGSNRYNAGAVRLVRAGQSFALLDTPASRTAPAGSQTPFDPILLASSSGSGTAWGGARISGEGDPEFSLDGGATWVTEAIVKSGDSVRVRMTAGARGVTRHATLTLRSGQTTGTTANCGNCGDEATTVQEGNTATFTVKGAVEDFAPEFNDTVRSIAVQPDGHLLIGGNFTSIDGQSRERLARLLPDGTLDASFAPSADLTVLTLLVQPDGRILASGEFTQVSGQARTSVARLHPDGALDDGFAPQIDAQVVDMALQADGKILIGGDFTEVNGEPRQYLARLNADGSLDAGFTPQADAPVQRVVVRPDGRIVIGGDFTQIDGQARQHLAQLDAAGTLTPGFGSGLTGTVSALAVQPDGKLLVGERFVGQTEQKLVRFHADGTLDGSFQITVTGGNQSTIGTVLMQADGRILLGGVFSHVNGVQRWRLARVNLAGELDDFHPDVGGWLAALAQQPDGKLVLGGNFDTVAGTPRARLARVYADGSLDAAWTQAVQRDYVLSLAVRPDDKVMIGGYFDWSGDGVHVNLAQLHPDGTLDGGYAPGPDGEVLGLTVQPDGKTLVTGYFSQIAGQARTGFARLNADGQIDAGFNPFIPDGEVYGSLVQPDGAILVWRGSTMLRLSAEGVRDDGFSPQLDGGVDSAALQADGRIVIGGYFSIINGSPRAGIARLEADGTLDPDFHPDVDGDVAAVAVQPDGKVLVGGWFDDINGEPRGNIARLNPDGSLDAAFAPQMDYGVVSLVLQPDGRMLVGGSFEQVNGQPLRGIARLNPDGSLDASLQLDGEAYGLALQPDGNILMGGWFPQAGTGSHYNLGRIALPEAALQSLAVGTDRSSMVWQRSGSGPEVRDVWFEHSDDGLYWQTLGPATRVAGGWSLDGLALPRAQNLWLRARGFTSGGQYNRSGGLIESVRLVYLHPVVTGAVTGLAGSGLQLHLDGGDGGAGETLPITANGPFAFTMPMAQGATYTVTIASQPAQQFCEIDNASGTMPADDVDDVQVICVYDSSVIFINGFEL